MNRKRFRAAREAFAATPNSDSHGFGLGLGQSHANQRSKAADETVPSATAFDEDRGRGRRHGRGGRGGHGRRRNKATQREKIDTRLDAKLRKCAKNFIICRDQSRRMEGPFDDPWKLWGQKSSDDCTCRPLRPIFLAVEATMERWGDQGLYHWIMAKRMHIWSVDSEYRQTWFLQQRHPGHGESICIRPWFIVDDAGVPGYQDPAYLVKAWISEAGEVAIGLSEQDEIPLAKLLDEMAARHFLHRVPDSDVWNYWVANGEKFNWAGLPDEIKLNIMGHLVQGEEVRPYEKPMGRGALARREKDPPPEVAKCWQIMEGLLHALPKCDDQYLGLHHMNLMAIDFLMARNVFYFQNIQALRRFLKNMGPAVQKVRKIKLHFQYEEFLLLFCNDSLPLATEPDGSHQSMLLIRHEPMEVFKTILRRLKTLNLTELKIHVRKSPSTYLIKMAHYGYVAWGFQCHRGLQIYIFRRMVFHFAHVRKLGVDFDRGPRDAPIHETLAKIHCDAMNHPEGELRTARKAREEVRLLETRGEEYEDSDGGVRLPLRQPKLKGWAEHSSRSRFPGLECAHDPVVWRDDGQQRSNMLFPCAAHPLDRCQNVDDCIFGTFTPGRLRQAPDEWEPTDENGKRKMEEWEAAQTNGDGQEFDGEDDDRPASYPSFSPWLEPEGLLGEDGNDGE